MRKFRTVHALDLAVARERLAFSRIKRKYANQVLSFLDHQGRLILVHRSTGPGRERVPWRVTYFDAGEPCGHADALDHADAITIARQYGAKAETVVRRPEP